MPDDADVDVDTDDETDESEDAVRCWLVERSYDDRNLITLVYATADGQHCLRKEQSATVMHQRGTTVTAAVEADPDDLDDVAAEERDRYATEAARMADSHAPDDEV